MIETSTRKLMAAVVVVLAVSAAALAGVAYFGGEEGDTNAEMPWKDHLACTQDLASLNTTAQNTTTPNATTARTPEPGMVLTSAAPMGVTVDVDEKNESVTFTIIDGEDADIFYLAGDHRYENFPVVCEDKVTLSGDELREEGELRLMVAIWENGRVGEVKLENGTRVLTQAPHKSNPATAAHIVTYDFTEDKGE